MAVGGIVQLWTDSGIQITVLLSLTFQVVLFFLAGIRRRKASTVLMLLLWLVYLLADITAIYALGHMSYASLSGKNQLMAFWAPLMLVHLGGPDTITAYAIEDCRLWPRHLLMLVVQTLGAAFVLSKYSVVATGGSLHPKAPFFIFVVGVLKYGERTWALRCGSMGGIKSIFNPVKATGFNSYMEWTVKNSLPNQRDDNEEELLTLAHFLLRKCAEPFTGSPVCALDNTQDVYPLQGDDMYNLIQMQLSLMYDIMYTKAWVIQTWYGYCIRIVSLEVTIIIFMVFSSSNKNGYSRVDVNITYILLVGVLVLEIISVLTTMGSTWMCARLCRFKAALMLRTGLKFIRSRVGAASKRRWSSSIGQYNLFHFCTRDKTELGGMMWLQNWWRIVRLPNWSMRVGLQNWWMRVHFVCTTDISETHLPRLLLETLPKLDPRNSRGIQVLKSSGLGKEEAGWSHWSLSLDFAHSILIWHIATDVYLCRSKEAGRQGDLAKAVKMLSNYMMFLLVTKPDMLPGYIDESCLNQTCCFLDIMWSRHQGDRESPNKWWDMLKKLFHGDGPNESCRIPQIEQLALSFHSRFLSDYEGKWEYAPPESVKPDSASYAAANMHAAEHAAELLHLESRKPDLLEAIFGVWVEMLLYAALRCGPESHARHLNTGGEFITVAWILIRHFHTPPRRSHLLYT